MELQHSGSRRLEEYSMAGGCLRGISLYLKRGNQDLVFSADA
jgi:hypothetical protein